MLAEKAGTRVGGMFTNLPSNVLISLIFISLINSPEYVVKTTAVIPLGMLTGSFFLFTFILTLRFGVGVAGTAALAVWFALAWLFTRISGDSLPVNVLWYAGISLLLFLVLEYGVKVRSVPRKQKCYSSRSILLRALFAGIVVGTTVYISSFASPVWVGVISTFPAVLLSTMLILSINQGPDFAGATGKVLVLSSSNVIIYILGVHLTYPTLGIAWGTVISFFMALVWIFLLSPVLRRTL